jgi:hypothetical protein
MPQPKYIQDLYKIIETVPYGTVDIQIKRVDRKTARITTSSEETLRYVNNQEAMKDLIIMINQLVGASFSGQAHIKLDMKDGNIKLIGLFDQKDTKYS